MMNDVVKLKKRHMLFQRVIDIDIFTEEQIGERLIIRPRAGLYYFASKAWGDPALRTICVKSWQELWYCKILNGYCGQFRKSIAQLGMQDTAVAYSAISSGKPDALRSMVYVKNENDILVLKIAAA